MKTFPSLLAFARPLAVLGARYEELPCGTLRYASSRPGAGFIGHGWVARDLDGRRVLRHRWLDKATGRTSLGRSPDELGRMRAAALAVVLALATWLTAGLGVHHQRHPRRLQRWLARALPGALLTLQRVRQAVMERCEPAVLEDWFPGGLSPPGDGRQRWNEPSKVWRLTEAFFLLLAGAERLSVQPSTLLAEARERWPVPTSEALI